MLCLASFFLHSHLHSAILRRLINRELVAWQPDPEDITDATMFGLEESHESGWDQFAVNEKKFGYQSGWNEDYYTVKVDREK
jgi:PAB1-binding protein PBP1